MAQNENITSEIVKIMRGGTIKVVQQEISKANLDRLKTWVSKGWIKNTNPEEVFNNYKTLLKNIRETYEKINTRKSHLSTLVDSLKRFKATDKKNLLPTEIIQEISSETTELNKKNEEEHKDNVRKGRRAENPITKERMNEVRDSLETKQEKKPTLNDEIKLTSVALNTYQPPIRGELSDMQIVDEKDVKESDKSNLLVRKPDGSYYYLMRDYKTVRNYGTQKIPLTPSANTFMKESLKRFPRDYVLTKFTDSKKPLGALLMNRMYNGLLGDTGGVNTIRAAYISDYLAKQRSTGEEEKLSKYMLTSPDRMRTIYRYIEEGKDVDKLEESEEVEENKEKGKEKGKEKVSIPQKKEIIEDKKQKIEKQRENDKATMKKYYENNPEYFKEKNKEYFKANKEKIARNKILRRAANDLILGVKTVQRATLNRYGITDNEIREKAEED